MPDKTDILSWLHIGDLHITRAGQDSHRDLLRIVDLAQGLAPGSVDFALLPGDNADDGTAEQFALVRDAVARLPMALHILPGDHDFKPRTLDAFHGVLGAERLPKSITEQGHRCLFLDVVSAGSGGPDFRLGDAQLTWVEQEIEQAAADGQDVVMFMHTYPADLRHGAQRLGALLARPHVTCVDMGHTHYNELANDGGTIFMTTRSTGQIEEGPSGFSIAAVDRRGVGWRFKTLDQAWPCVVITHPVDRRLLTRRAETRPFQIRAKVVGDAPIEAVEARVDDGDWMPMTPLPGAVAVWQAAAPQGERVIVRARDAHGRLDQDRVDPAGPDWIPPRRRGDGSDGDRIGAWREKAIFDTQLGPNRNGRKW
ncbi:metallophosphoesterase family protein [Rhodopila sp.]|uniref:metallophosphoesterase family protein n=1 Tax=Rhodopila sp. TaxID=2480087 RepID=UPI003D0FD9E4